ncbi:MAG: hypothetical protein PHR77_12595 [Kiritimatiellae bacterium]|nr:hypothetical protein [Kiritimatiellia bacterium]MDD5520785.1 hypothetical protein [Kiritimatiellia bacterium]
MKDSEPIFSPSDKQSGTGGVDLRTGAGVGWLVSCILAMVISVSIMKTIFKDIKMYELFLGWILASVNAVLAVMINITAMKKRSKGFIAWGAMGNVLRSIGVLAIILLVKLLDKVKFEPFITSFLVCYFVFMIAETIRMNVLNMRSSGENE